MRSAIVLFSFLLLTCAHVGSAGNGQLAGSFLGELVFAPMGMSDGLLLSVEGKKETLVVLIRRTGTVSFNLKEDGSLREFRPDEMVSEDGCDLYSVNRIAVVRLKFCRGDPAVAIFVTDYKSMFVGHFKVQEKPDVQKQSL